MTENECECTSEVRASWSEQKEKRVNETGFQRQCSPDCENGLALGVQTKPAEQSELASQFTVILPQAPEYARAAYDAELSSAEG